MTLGMTALSGVATVSAKADGWKPTGPVEFVVPGGPGSVGDRRARKLEEIWRTKGYVDVPVVIVNKGGGAHAIYANYLNSRPADSALGITLGALLSAQILKQHDFDFRSLTSIAYIGNEYYIWVVKADSSIKGGKDLFDRLRKDPQSLVIGASNPGGPGHIQILSVLRDAGVDISKIKVVTFAGGGETRTALLGGHIDVTATSASNMVEFQESGDVRAIAVNSKNHLPAPFADVPTLEEAGVTPQWYLNSWTVVSGPGGMTDEMVTFWEDVLRKTMDTEEWKEDAATSLRDLDFKGSAETKDLLEKEYTATEKMISETIGMPD
jgi:putative tricarboxylic transport membrane protein